MRIGQTSFVVFLSKVVASALGFVATIYFARVLGAEVLGVYALVVALVAWLRLTARVGIGQAMIKRISEGDDQSEHMMAGIILLAVLAVLVGAAVVLARGYVESYVDGFDQYATLSVIWFVLALFLFESVTSAVHSTLHGEGKVHIVGLLKPVNVGSRSMIQLGLAVFAGAGLVGLLVGHILGVAIIALIGVVFVSVRPRLPDMRHVRSLVDYAKFSWLSSLQSRTYNDVDIVMLGVFVQTSLVGVYSVAWSLTKFLDIFGVAVSQSVFPEISSISAQEGAKAAAGHIKDAIAYAGFITLPGFVGGALLADRLLRVYGADFLVGRNVLWLLLLSILFFSYMKQFLNALNAIDEPRLAFAVNVVFIATNITLNGALIWQFGWVGAAVASATSAFVGLCLGYALFVREVSFDLPVAEITKQAVAALVMGVVVVVGESAVEATGVVEQNIVIVVGLVTVGVGVYVVTLLALSSRFRATVRRNLPVDVPHLT